SSGRDPELSCCDSSSDAVRHGGRSLSSASHRHAPCVPARRDALPGKCRRPHRSTYPNWTPPGAAGLSHITWVTGDLPLRAMLVHHWVIRKLIPDKGFV